MKKSIYLLTISLLTLLTASLKSGSLAQTDSSLTGCGQYRQADSELNNVYQQIFKDYKSDALFLQKLKNAQRAWLAYRDANLESRYPAADKRSAYGSVFNECYCLALTELTIKRTEELRQWVKGTHEGDVCAGSLKIKN